MKEKRLWKGRVFLLFWLLMIFGQEAEATVIAVHYGQYPSAREAAFDERSINWSDDDLSDDTICTASFAAVELQHYLRQMTGRTEDFAIIRPEELESVSNQNVILLATFDELKMSFLAELKGREDRNVGLGSEGYIIQTVWISGQPSVLIAAAGRVGLLYGAYDFLHRLGVRWYAPGPAHEVVPRRTLEPFPDDFDVRETPSFITRGFHAWEDRADRKFLLWMARNRLNYWCVEQSDKAFLHKIGIKLVGGGHILTSLYLGPNLDYPYNHSRFKGDEAKPTDPYPISKEYQGDLNGDGRLSYFEAHPEWYGLIKGKRSPRIEGDFGDNFCTSNADALAEWTKNAVADLAHGNYQDADFVNLWTLDFGNWCECEKCRALGSPTDRNILFVHALAKAIKKAQAEKIINRPVKLFFLAYGDVIDPPTKPLPADFDYDMCIATFFPIRRCYVHHFDDSSCSVNSRYFHQFKAWFLAPDRFYRGALCIGEYYNVSGYKCLPVCYMHSMAHDIPFYSAAAARHFHYMHVTTDQWGSKALTNWQMARQLWDPSIDCETLWNDYFSGRYGPAQSLMRQFYERLEGMLANVSELKYGLAQRLGHGETELFPDHHLQYEKTVFPNDDGPDLVEIVEAARLCSRLLNEAKSLGLPPEFARRIVEDERAFRYAERTILFYDALCRATFRLAAGRTAEARAALWAARDLSFLLKADTTSTKFSSSHANAADALEASFASAALPRLEEKIGLIEEKAIIGAPLYPDRSRLLVYKDEDGNEHVVRTIDDWEIRRHHVLLNFLKVAGPFPPETRRVPLDIQFLGEEDLGDVVRKKVSFATEPGNRSFAFLLTPKNTSAPLPAVLCLHQTTPRGKDEPAGVAGNQELCLALELARRGYVTLAPDYPGYGEDQTDAYALGYASATMKGIWNHLRAVDFLVSLPEVDAERIAVAGHSLGGHNAIFVALFDPRLKAVVTSCGFTSFEKYYGGDLTGWSHRGYMPRIATIYAKEADQIPFDFSELLAALAPRSVFINAPLRDDNFEVRGVQDCVWAAEPVYELLGAKGSLIVVHPEAAHSFPSEVRQKAYDFLDRLFDKVP